MKYDFLEVWRSELQNMSKLFYDINSLAPLDLFVIFNSFKINLLFHFSSSGLFPLKIISFPDASETCRITGGVTYCVTNIAMS